MRNTRSVTRPRPTTTWWLAFRPMVGMVIVLLALSLVSCNRDAPTQPSTAGSTVDKSSILANGVAISDGIPGADSSAALFTIEYGMRRMPGMVGDGSGEARAIAFSSIAGPIADGKRAGLDIGVVTLTAGSQSLTLQKLSDEHGTVYSLRGKPGSETGGGVNYAGGAVYTFAVSGSSVFSQGTFSISAPTARLAISGLTEGQVVGKSNNLNVSWMGGDSAGSVQLRIMPAPPKPDSAHNGHPAGGMDGRDHGRGPGMGGPGHGGPGMGGPGHGGPEMDGQGGHGLDSTHMLIVNLSANSGGYAVTPAQLAAIIAGLQTSDVVISVSQVKSLTVQHDGKQVRIAFRDDAHVKVVLQ